MTTAAAIDRLVHHSVILEFDVESYRTKKAKKRSCRATTYGFPPGREVAAPLHHPGSRPAEVVVVDRQEWLPLITRDHPRQRIDELLPQNWQPPEPAAA